MSMLRAIVILIATLVIALTLLNSVRIAPFINWSFYNIESRLQTITDNHASEPSSTEDLFTLTAEVAALREENLELRTLLELSAVNDFDIIFASIISRDIINPTIVTINKGLHDNLEAGLAVIANNGTVVGKIAKVTNNRSTIELLSSDFSKLAVKVQNEDLTTGILSGRLSSSLVMDFIPEQTALAINDIIVTSGLEPHIPPNLPVGRTAQVINNADQLFKQAYINAGVNYNQLRFVAIVRTP